MKTNTFYKYSPREIIKIPLNKCSNIGENSYSSSSIDSERLPSRKVSPKNSFFISLELELKKVLPETIIRNESDLKKAIKTLTSKLISGNFPCKTCQERSEMIEKSNNDLHQQKKAALDEMENLKEMKAQVKKYENLLKTKEKNLELQRINLSENSEILEKKSQMIEKNKRVFEAEKEKIKEERLKLEEDKIWFNKKFKKLDEQYFYANRELTEREFRESSELPTKEKQEILIKTEELNQTLLEIKQKHQIVMEIIEKFGEMKGKFEENQKNFEIIIKEKLSKDQAKELKNKEKLKKIKQKVKTMEEKMKELINKNNDLSFIRTEEVTEKYITKTPSETDSDDKDLMIRKYKDKCQKLEESLFKKRIELQDVNCLTDEIAEKTKDFEVREKELISMQEEIKKEKIDIGKTAEYLQDIWMQLEQKRNELDLEKQIIQTEKEANQTFGKRESVGKDKKGINISSAIPLIPSLNERRESYHFTDENLIVRINEKK